MTAHPRQTSPSNPSATPPSRSASNRPAHRKQTPKRTTRQHHKKRRKQQKRTSQKPNRTPENRQTTHTPQKKTEQNNQQKITPQPHSSSHSSPYSSLSSAFWHSPSREHERPAPQLLHKSSPFGFSGVQLVIAGRAGEEREPLRRWRHPPLSQRRTLVATRRKRQDAAGRQGPPTPESPAYRGGLRVSR